MTLQAPPRQIPWLTKLVIVFGQGQTLPAGIFATVFLALCWFIFWQPLKLDLKFQQPTTLVKANLSLISQVSSTPRRRSRRSNSVPIYACHFNFEYQGRSIQAISYFSATQPPLQGIKVVPVEFVPKQPEMARINLPGYRYTQINPWLMVSAWFAWPFILLPFICYVIWFSLVIKGLGLLKLLTQGKVGKARLLLNQETNWTTKNQAGKLTKLHRLIFAYDVAGSIHEIELKTGEIDTITDDKQEAVIYLPQNPKQARIIDSLPEFLAQSQGSFVTSKPVEAYLAGILTLVILFASTYFLFL